MTSLREGWTPLKNLDSRIHADGEIDIVRACAERGTIVVTPTHSSNMDSPAIGFGLMRAGLPPVTYGAGKNLFTNPFISFFMRNLGAYRVDRRLRFELYKDVLKEYSTVLLEHGYHSLFFPGGTRCRVEHRREAPQARPARHHGHRVQEQRPRGRAEQAPLHRARRRSTTGSCSRPRR